MATREFLFVNTDGAGFIFNDYALSSADSVDLQGAGIVNLKDPVNPQDAATKNYVDNHGATEVNEIRTADIVGIPAFAGVYYSANDIISKGDSSNVAKVGIIGIAPASIGSNASGTIRKAGVVAGALTGAVAGTPYYLGHTGLPILASALVNGDRIIRLGFAKNATDLEVAIQDQSKK